MSNDEIMARANKIATGLIAKGVSHGEAINLLMRNDIEFIVGMAAATQIGAVGTPINTHFSAISHSDLWHNLSEKVIPLLEREVTILLVETPKYLRAPYKISDELCTLRSGDIELAEWESKFSPHEKAVSVRPAAMIYTSGTTGRPKGVRRKEAVSVKLKNHHNAYVAGMRCLLAAPLYHSAPFSTADGVFAVEGDLILTPRFDPEFYLTLIEKHRITHSFMVPTMFTRLLKLPDAIRLKYDVWQIFPLRSK